MLNDVYVISVSYATFTARTKLLYCIISSCFGMIFLTVLPLFLDTDDLCVFSVLSAFSPGAGGLLIIASMSIVCSYIVFEQGCFSPQVKFRIVMLVYDVRILLLHNTTTTRTLLL